MDRTLIFLLLSILVQSIGCMNRVDVKQCPNTNRPRQHLPVSFYVDQNSISNEIYEEIELAAEDWNKASNQTLIVINGFTDKAPIAPDGRNVIVISALEYRVNGTTRNYYVNDKIVDSDIILSSFNRTDRESVLVHEMGHSLGLEHNESTDSVMQPSMSSQQIRRTPSEEDISAINCLYN